MHKSIGTVGFENKELGILKTNGHYESATVLSNNNLLRSISTWSPCVWFIHCHKEHAPAIVPNLSGAGCRGRCSGCWPFDGTLDWILDLNGIKHWIQCYNVQSSAHTGELDKLPLLSWKEWILDGYGLFAAVGSVNQAVPSIWSTYTLHIWEEGTDAEWTDPQRWLHNPF